MTAHGMLVTVFATLVVLFVGYDYWDPEVDPRRLLAPLLATLVLCAGITWQLGV